MTDFLSIYPAKAAEYLLAIEYLICFCWLWHYLNTPKKEDKS